MTITQELSLHFTRAVAVATKPKTIYGNAIVYNSQSVDLGGYVEVIARGAFDADIATGKNIVCLYEHESNNILGQTSDGTLKLTPDDKGVQFELTLPDTPFGQSVYDKVKAGGLDGMSFGFRSQVVEWDLTKSVKTVKLGTISEVTLTSQPAYEMTVALTRSKRTEAQPPISETPKELNRLDNNVHRLKMLG